MRNSRSLKMSLPDYYLDDLVKRSMAPPFKMSLPDCYNDKLAKDSTFHPFAELGLECLGMSMAPGRLVRSCTINNFSLHTNPLDFIG